MRLPESVGIRSCYEQAGGARDGAGPALEQGAFRCISAQQWKISTAALPGSRVTTDTTRVGIVGIQGQRGQGPTNRGQEAGRTKMHVDASAMVVSTMPALAALVCIRG